MSCSTCKKVQIPETFVSGLPYMLAPDIIAVEGRNGRMYPLTKSLITKPHEPRRGWSVVFYVNDQREDIKGASPEIIAAKVKSLFTLNSVPFDNLNLWFNLNIQWVERAVEKYQQIKLPQLLSLVQP